MADGLPHDVAERPRRQCFTMQMEHLRAREHGRVRRIDHLHVHGHDRARDGDLDREFGAVFYDPVRAGGRHHATSSSQTCRFRDTAIQAIFSASEVSIEWPSNLRVSTFTPISLMARI